MSIDCGSVNFFCFSKMAARSRRVVCVYDRRSGDGAPVNFDINQYKNYTEFSRKVCEAFGINVKDKPVICNTGREVIKNDRTFHVIEDGETLYVMSDAKQRLSSSTKKKVVFIPHYDTLIKSGMYEYYASEGQNPLPYAFAELVDNALSATSKNKGLRQIEIRLMFDDNCEKTTIFVIDNGHGMTSRQLNNWAIYRLSKFTRNEHPRSASRNEADGSPISPPSSPAVQHFPRSLNSEISYFGVGGKQAIFFIGDSTRMMTKPKGCCDVHEMSISKVEFEEKELKGEHIYDGYIVNREPGNASHLPADDEYVQRMIEEERNKDSFTCVVIQGISQEHASFLKLNFSTWCRQLAHIYHYYIHGPEGNVAQNNNKATESKRPSSLGELSIEVKMFNRGVVIKTLDLLSVSDDMQTLYVRSSVSEFEFKAVVEGRGIVEGVLRYHPFLYDKETYPSGALENTKILDDDDALEFENLAGKAAQNRRPIFECFWNGRLIPYTLIDDFEWCSTPKRNKNISLDCYNRISGVLWTDCVFQVSTNKLTFMDLEVKLRDKNTVFNRLINGQEKRGNIDKQFSEWLLECHEKYDKQIHFKKFLGLIHRPELPKTKQYPWSTFNAIKWDDRTFKNGQLVKLHRVIPVQFGSIKRFLLYGEHGDRNVFSTGGFVEWVQEPQCLYGEVKVHPIGKLDRLTSEADVRRWIKDEEDRLPDKLVISWPEGDEVDNGSKIPAGSAIGALKVEIANCKEEFISKLPGTSQKKLYVDLKIVYHSSTADVVVVHHIGQHAKTWPYWFKKMENFNNLGSYTLKLQVVLSENNSTVYAGRQLPSHSLKFSVTEAEPKRFTIGIMDGPLLVGAPFNLPLNFEDKFGNGTKPSAKYSPILTSSGLVIKYDGVHVKGNTLQVKNIIATGKVDSNAGKNFTLSVKIPQLDGVSQTVKIRLLPGPPCRLFITPEESPIVVENGQKLSLDVQVQDAAGNNTNAPKLSVTCKFIDHQAQIPDYAGSCDSSGQVVLTGSPIRIAGMSGPIAITAIIEAKNSKEIPNVEKTVKINPSTLAAKMKISYKDGSSGKRVEIEAGKDLVYTANGVVSKLEFQLLDEVGRKINLTNQVASKIKVNWVPKANMDQLLKGKLPDIKVPCSVRESKYCNVAVSSVIGTAEFSFNVKPLPGSPATLKCTFSNKCDRVRLGETLPSDILVTPLDTQGNPVRKLTISDLKSLTVTADSLCPDKLVRAIGQGNVFLIQGITFTGGRLGAREICIKWQDIVGYVRLMVLAGPPSIIHLPHFECTDLITIQNGSQLSVPLAVELQDCFGNAAEDSNVKVQLLCDPNLKLLPTPQVLKTNKAGTANFHALTVSVLPKLAPSLCTESMCTRPCYGVLCVTPRATHGREQILGPTIQFHVTSDVSKPATVSVEYDNEANCVVKEELPVMVLAEDSSTLSHESDSTIVMNMWQGESKQSKSGVVDNFCIRKVSDELGQFHFSKVRAPSVSGVYTVQFTFKSDCHTLTSALIRLKVLPQVPTILVADKPRATSTVSNTARAANRVLIKNLKLQLKDLYENSVVDGFGGKVLVRFTSSDRSELPVFIGGLKEMSFNLKNGQASLQNVSIEENSPGVDGKEYFLCCEVFLTDPSGKKNSLIDAISIPPYTIPFLFYNDSEKQTRMANLSKERDKLMHTVNAFRSFFETSQELGVQLKENVQKTVEEQNKLRAQLLNYDEIKPSILNSINHVSAFVEQQSRERELMKTIPRRRCNLQPAPKEPNILGKVAFLAEVEDDDVARVISWHMSGDMDCLITHNMEKAKEVYQRTKGVQQVLSLDAVYRRNLSDWNKPLPHQKTRGNFQPTGNPQYARHFLIFPGETENCQIVFLSLLGDAIILDTLEDATTYRREVVMQTFCPNLLTRTGDRVLSNGKFGGRQNKAPSIESLRGAIFSKPISSNYANVSAMIDLLRSYQSLLRRHQDAILQLSAHQQSQGTKEMHEKRKELKQLEKKLQEVDTTLGTNTSGFLTPSPGVRLRDRSVSAPSTAEGLYSAGPSSAAVTTGDEEQGEKEEEKEKEQEKEQEEEEEVDEIVNRAVTRPRRTSKDSGFASSGTSNGDTTPREYSNSVNATGSETSPAHSSSMSLRKRSGRSSPMVGSSVTSAKRQRR